MDNDAYKYLIDDICNVLSQLICREHSLIACDDKTKAADVVIYYQRKLSNLLKEIKSNIEELKKN